MRRARVHDLKHKFDRRLRAASDRQDGLGHNGGRIITHCSQAEIASLIAAAEDVCEADSRKNPTTTSIRRRAG